MKVGKKVVYFICIGNSARSQMAEGFAKALGGDVFEVYSGGTDPKGLNPYAVEVMKEVGIDISGQTSDPINVSILKRCSLVVTLCGDARDNCPVIPPGVEHRHWSLEDPAGAVGSREEVLNVFRKTRDEIKKLVEDLVEEFGSV
ncbi:MAG: Protein-tyrosine-phosphatase [Clostridia bacterium 41_269]|nr:MAG: Protein-tyrosine-phosphatase [Clostridia bacterium 41_269]